MEQNLLKLPFVTKEQVEEIVKTYPTPFHLYDEAGIRANAKAVCEAFAWNPGFREYFAVKATPNPFLLDILKVCSWIIQQYLQIDRLTHRRIRLLK